MFVLPLAILMKAGGGKDPQYPQSMSLIGFACPSRDGKQPRSVPGSDLSMPLALSWERSGPIAKNALDARGRGHDGKRSAFGIWQVSRGS